MYWYISRERKTLNTHQKKKNSNAYEAITYIADSRKPEMNIEMLPAQLFFSLNGSFTEPYLLPTMSAKPAKLYGPRRCRSLSRNNQMQWRSTK
jgi:hypothetical protein